MPGLTRTCFVCKQQFPKEQMLQYASVNAKKMNWYCKKCLDEKKEREIFSDKVCYIFGIKSPGPRIWTERERLIKKYGYTDQTIIDCLDYLYNIKKVKKLAESLYLITPQSVEDMLQYRKRRAEDARKLAKSLQAEQREYIVPVKKKKTIEQISYDPDEWLDD